jgi:hypothetical protein
VTLTRRKATASAFGQVTVSTPSRITAALEPVVLLAGTRAFPPQSRQRDGVLGGFHGDVGFEEAGQFGGQHVGLGRFMQIDRRMPARGPGREPVKALLDSEKVAQWIPAGERHKRHPSIGIGGLEAGPDHDDRCATIHRFPRRQRWRPYKRPE